MSSGDVSARWLPVHLLPPGKLPARVTAALASALAGAAGGGGFGLSTFQQRLSGLVPRRPVVLVPSFPDGKNEATELASGGRHGQGLNGPLLRLMSLELL